MTNHRAFIDALTTASSRAIAAIAGAPSPDAALEAALGALVEATGDDAGWSIFLIDHERLWSVAHRGYTMVPGGIALDRGILGRAVRTGRAQFVPDVRDDVEYVPGKRGMASELVLPIEGAGGLLGVMSIETPFELPVEAVGRLEPVAVALAGPLLELRQAPAVDLSSLVRVFVHMSSLRDAREIAELAARSLAHVLGLEACQVTLADEASGEIVAAWSRSGATDSLPEDVVETLRAHVDRASVFEKIDVAEAGLAGVAGDCRTLVWLPLRVNDVDVGELVGAARGALVFPRAQAEAAALLAAQAAASLDAALALVRERRMAATDPLTGLLNRRGFGDVLEEQLEQSGAERSPLSLCVLDCDEFKAVNDRGGHERGDRVLLELADLIRASLAPGAAAARLGGDEFALTLPGTDAAAALRIADALRVRLAQGLSEAGTPLQVSIGVATYPFDGATATQLLRAADQGLYAAKSSGKDLVVAFRDLGDWTRRGAAARARERRGRLRPVVAPDAVAQIAAVRGEQAPQQVLLVLARALTGTLSATATVVSWIIPGGRLIDVARYALRDIELGTDAAYLLEDFPLTKRVLEHREPVAMSFLDANIDRAEAFILRGLGMSSLLMMPLVARGEAAALVEVYDVRLREFEAGDVDMARALVMAAAQRLEELAAGGADLVPLGDRADAPVQRPIRGEAPRIERSSRAGESG